MKIAYFDCPCGASGDMLLGALLDAGIEIDDLKDKLNGLHLQGFDLEARRIQKLGISATLAKVIVQDHKTERRLPEIQQLVQESHLPPKIKDQATTILTRIGEVEAKYPRAGHRSSPPARAGRAGYDR